MARRCDLTGKGPMSGNNVSHSHRKTRRRFLPNLRPITLRSEGLRGDVRLKVSIAALRTLTRKGGLDAFLLDARAEDLSDKAQVLRRRLRRTLRAPPASTPISH